MTPPDTPTRIETARELFEALRSPDLRTRIAVIGGLARDPRAGLLLGQHEGRDIIDALIATIEAEPEGSGLGRPMAQILSAYADGRVLRFFARQLEAGREFEMIAVAAGYLARTDEGRDAVRALLRHTERPAHAQAAARALLATQADLPPHERLRAALLDGATPPPLDAGTLTPWLDELSGPLRRRAREHLGAQDEGALRLLGTAWDRLDADARVALLRAARDRAPAAAAEVLPAALRSEQSELLLAALECLAALGPGGDELRPPLSAFLARPEPALVVAALAVARLDTDPRDLLSPERDMTIRCAALRRITREDPSGALPLLLGALTDSQWQLRATAAQLLGALGEPARAAVRPLTLHEDPAVRLAAAQVLAQ